MIDAKEDGRRSRKGWLAGLAAGVLAVSGGGVAWGVSSSKQAAEALEAAQSEYETVVLEAGSVFESLEVELGKVDNFTDKAPVAVVDGLDFTVIDQAREITGPPERVQIVDLSVDDISVQVGIQQDFIDTTTSITTEVSEWLAEAETAHLDYEKARLDKTSETFANTIGKAERVLTGSKGKVREQDAQVRDDLAQQIESAQGVADTEVDESDPGAIASHVQDIVEANRTLNASVKSVQEAPAKWREVHDANQKAKAEREAAARQQQTSSSGSSSGHSPAGGGSGGSSGGSGIWTPQAPSGGSSGGGQPLKPAPSCDVQGRCSGPRP